MGYWGKVIGGFAGFAMGGPFGAMVGAAIGHAADSGLSEGMRMSFFSIGDPLATAATFARLSGQREQVLSLGAVVLSAKLARCDGPVNRAEIDAFKRHFHVPAEAVGNIGRLFDQARDSQHDFATYADQIGESYASDPTPLENVLAALYSIARADGPLNRAEEAFLQRVTQGFRLNANASGRARDGNPLGPSSDEGDPYALLGVSRTSSDAALRVAWKTLVRKNHPDTLSAQGASAAAIARANDTVARINAAWDRVKRERSL